MIKLKNLMTEDKQFETYNLFLDDEREPKDCTWMNDSRYTNFKWVVVRSHDEFVRTLTDRFNRNEVPELVSFDHDLADVGSNAREKTGNDSAKFLVQWCIDNSINLPECLVHSKNPIGKERIKQTINDYNRFQTRNNTQGQ
jgi:hypothetical protein